MPAQGCGCWGALYRRIFGTTRHGATEGQHTVAQAMRYFARLEIPKNAAVIFDVDDTAIDKSNNAIVEVYRLYDLLVQRGVKIIFVTSRPETAPEIGHQDYVQYTREILAAAGYKTCEQLICMPKHLRDACKGKKFRTRVASWKEGRRRQIAEHYTIIGCVDDCEENLKGTDLGYTVLVEADDDFFDRRM